MTEMNNTIVGSGADLSGVDFEDLVAEMIRRCGDSPEREGMMKTPERVAKAMAFLTKGYTESPEAVVGDAIFSENHQSMVLVKDIEIYSLCEHHMLPFFGKAHVAYIPNGNVMGLSKVARLVEVYARRFQVQERLTEQVAQAVWETTNPQGVAVIIQARHFCMCYRGVRQSKAWTTTSKLHGVFLQDPAARMELFTLIGSNPGRD